ncbi:MAG: hypothetical protein QF745_08330, partial [Planctomycetota bacterium]|nr:hypothetical protein [Planctomycetota bacterium]
RGLRLTRSGIMFFWMMAGSGIFAAPADNCSRHHWAQLFLAPFQSLGLRFFRPQEPFLFRHGVSLRTTNTEARQPRALRTMLLQPSPQARAL